MNQMLDFPFTNGHLSPRWTHWSQEAASFRWSVCNVLLKFRIAEYAASRCKSLAAVSDPQLRMLANAKASTFIHRWMTYPEWLIGFAFWLVWFCLSSQTKLQWIRSQPSVLPNKCYIWFCHFSSRLCLQPAENKHKRWIQGLSTSFLVYSSWQPSLPFFVPSNEVIDFIMEQQWP